MAAPRSWGVSWCPGMAHCGDLESCPSCNWSNNHTLTRGPQGMDFMVGYDSGAPCDPDDDQAGAFVFECPACFEKFWFHANTATLDYLSTCLAAWPK